MYVGSVGVTLHFVKRVLKEKETPNEANVNNSVCRYAAVGKFFQKPSLPGSLKLKKNPWNNSFTFSYKSRSLFSIDVLSCSRMFHSFAAQDDTRYTT